MQRHPALQPLSRDHHDGLVAVRDLNKSLDGSDANRRAAIERFATLWHDEFRRHLELEDQWILPRLDDELRGRMGEEHTRIRELADAATNRQPNLDEDERHELASDLATHLRNHIRWEEREVFQWLQANLSQNELNNLSTVTTPQDVARRKRLASDA